MVAWADVLGETTGLDLQPGETLTGHPVWVLTVAFAGRLCRWATEDVEITTDDGDTLKIPGGLDIAPEQAVDVARLDGTEASISASGLYPPMDLSELVEDGHELDAQPAEVALWYEGRTWEERIVVLRGLTWLPHYGTREEPIALTIESPEYEDGGRLCEPNGVVSTVTLSGSKPGDKVDGRVYPLVIGRPDWVPAIIYDITQDKAVLAQGRTDASTVVVGRVEDGTTTNVSEYAGSTEEVRDDLGRWVTVADYSAALGLGLGYGDTMEVVSRWNSPSTVGGGILHEHGTGYVTGLGDVVRWAMRRSTIPIDEGRWHAVGDRLNRFLVDYWTNDPTQTPWDFVRDVLLPLVPVSILHGPRGLWPVWWPYDATGGAQDRCAEVDVQATGLERVGLVEYERDERPVNELTLEYYPWQGDLWRYRLTYSGAPRTDAETADTLWASTAPLRAAYVRHGEQRRAAKPIQSRAVYQRATAEQVLGWMQYARCRSPRVVTYEDVRGRWAWLSPGSVVSLVDDDLGIDRLAWVRRRAWSVGSVRLQFMLWDHQ